MHRKIIENKIIKEFNEQSLDFISCAIDFLEKDFISKINRRIYKLLNINYFEETYLDLIYKINFLFPNDHLIKINAYQQVKNELNNSYKQIIYHPMFNNSYFNKVKNDQELTLSISFYIIKINRKTDNLNYYFNEQIYKYKIFYFLHYLFYTLISSLIIFYLCYFLFDIYDYKNKILIFKEYLFIN